MTTRRTVCVGRLIITAGPPHTLLARVFYKVTVGPILHAMYVRKARTVYTAAEVWVWRAGV